MTIPDENTLTHCGFITLLGRPNVGKSTLLNALLRQKISITSKKPQTTRQRIRGIKTIENCQAIYVDTPGIHNISRHQLNKRMNSWAWNSIRDVDLILFVIEALTFRPDEAAILDKLKQVEKPIILVINKVDLCAQKGKLLPFLEKMQSLYPFVAMVPVCAEKNDGIDGLEKIIAGQLPLAPFYYPIDQVTDSSLSFRIAEIIREKLTRFLGQELPYVVAVEVSSIRDQINTKHINAIIWVTKNNQKSIVIGENGQKLKQIGQAARRDIEILLGRQAYLNLWVKVKENWVDNTDLLNQLGYGE